MMGFPGCVKICILDMALKQRDESPRAIVIQSGSRSTCSIRDGSRRCLGARLGAAAKQPISSMDGNTREEPPRPAHNASSTAGQGLAALSAGRLHRTSLLTSWRRTLWRLPMLLKQRGVSIARVPSNASSPCTVIFGEWWSRHSSAGGVWETASCFCRRSLSVGICCG